MAVVINGSAGVTTNSGAVYNGLQTDTAKSATGTSVDFTGIPSWAKRVTVMFSGVSTNGTAPPILQIGSGSVETTGYVGSNSIVLSTVVSANFTNGFGIGVNTANWTAAASVNGAITLCLQNAATNTWTASGSVASSASAAHYFTSGSKPLAGVLDRLRLYIDGTQQFDAGTINIIYE